MHKSNLTVILLMNRTDGKDGQFIRSWLEESRFLSQEAIDIFHAIETVSDFTNTYRPEVVLLEVESVSDDLPMLQQIVALTSGEIQIPFMTVTETKNKFGGSNNHYFGDLTQLKTKLDQMFPAHFQYQAAA